MRSVPSLAWLQASCAAGGNLTSCVDLMFVIVLQPIGGLFFPAFVIVLRCLLELACFTDICVLYRPVILHRPRGVDIL